MSIGGVQLNSPRNRPGPSVTGGVLLFSTIVLLVLSFLRVHYISGHGSADLLWNRNEAYIFVHGERLGDTPSYLGYLLALVKGYFGVMSPSDESKAFTTIVRVTSSGVERYEDNKEFDSFTPVNNDVYAMCQGSGELWRWTGNHFERMKTFDSIQLRKNMRVDKAEFSHINGWSGVYSIQLKKDQSLQMNDLAVTVAIKDRQVVVTLMRPRAGQTEAIAVRLYYGDPYPERVSRAEYERVFGN